LWEATLTQGSGSAAWRTLYDQIGSFLFDNQLEPTLQHYELARRYMTRTDSELVRRVDQAIARDGKLLAAAVADIIAVHSRIASIEEIMNMAGEARHRMQEAATTLDEAGGHVRDYAGALESGVSSLANVPGSEAVIAELIAMTRTMAERASMAEQQLVRTSNEIEALRSRLAEASRTANVDALTGLPNRRALDLRLREAFEAAQAAKSGFAIAICDIDHFKKVNDVHGHLVGDEVIKAVATALSRVGTGNLFVARYGGEEFVTIFEGVEPADAAAQLDAIRIELAAKQFSIRATGAVLRDISFSGGVCGMAGCKDASAMLKGADKALYRAKEEGRNRIFIDQ
jgi:diguanylate cyclase